MRCFLSPQQEFELDIKHRMYRVMEQRINDAVKRIEDLKEELMLEEIHLDRLQKEVNEVKQDYLQLMTCAEAY